MSIEKKKKKIIFTALILALIGYWSFSWNFSNAEDSTAEQIEELEKKAQQYREIIDIKQRQQESLSNQISLMDANINQFETEIELNKKKIEELNARISRSQAEIKDKDESIDLQKKLLADILKSVYEYHGRSIFSMMIIRDNLNPFLSEKDRIAQTSGKINDIIRELKSLKAKSEEEKMALEEDKLKLTKTHLDLKDKSENLESAKFSKEDLLAKTQGEEEKYKKLLEKVEQQKLELLNIDELYATSGLSVDDFPKPDSKYNASLSWYYSQKDSKWANVKIGNSKSLLKDYGCAVSSIAMVWTKLGSSITPKELAEKDQYFQWDLIAWPTSWKSIDLSYGSSHGNISWSTIDNEIKSGNPVIVYIGKSGSKGGHYVVIHHKDKNGKYVVHDPYFGPNIFLDTSRALVGAMGTNTTTYTDQMIVYKK